MAQNPKLFQRMIGSILVTLLLIGCDAPGATVEPQDRSTIPIATFTPVPPISPTAAVTPPSDTPNPTMETSLPSEQIDLPDLAVRGHQVMFNPGTCGWNGGQITVWFDNIGEADAGPFTVSIEGQGVRLDELPAGSSADASAQYNFVLGGVTALVDSNDEVIESDETNNAIGVTHTPPPTCTLTPTPTATMTATPIP